MILIGLVGVPPCPAQTFQETFDSYASQAAFAAVWSPLPQHLSLYPGWAMSPSNSVLQSSGSAQAVFRAMTPVAVTNLRLSFWFYDPSTSPGRTWVEVVAAGPNHPRTDQTQSLVIGKDNTLVTSKYSGQIGFGASAVPFSLDGAASRAVGWHFMEIIGYPNGTVQWKVDGTVGSTRTVAPANFNWVVVGSGVVSPTVAWFDDVRVGNIPPVIIKHPVSQSVAIDGYVRFSVVATGTGSSNMAYQWFFNGSPIPNAIGPAYEIYAASCTQAGSYRVLCHNGTGTNLSQAATLTVTDSVPPVISCPPNVTTQITGACSVVVNYPLPTVSDTCDPAPVVTCSPTNGSSFPAGTTIVSCTARDSSGLSNTCAFTVTVQDTEPPSLTCPADQLVSTAPGLCTAVVNYPAPQAADNCTVTHLVCSPPAGSVFALGATTVHCLAADGSGNTNTGAFTVTVQDIEPPSLTCPADQLVSTAPGLCTAVVNYPAPQAADNCTVTHLVCSPPAGSVFALGVTTVHCLASDGAGNTNTGAFTVTVRDTEPPQLACPGNILVDTTLGQCMKRNLTFFPAATDNCPGVTVSCAPPSGSDLTLGITTVICTATDLAGNTSQCSFAVTVRDAEAPQIVCPPDVITETDPGQCFRSGLAYPTATDNCAGVTLLCDPPVGSTFALGTTVVSCLALDAAGHSRACSFRVTVRDSEPPRLLCPTDQIADGDSARGAEVFFAALVTDNCGHTLEVNCVPPPGSLFPVGTNTVVCATRDASGNSSDCRFTLTVLCPVLQVERQGAHLVLSWLTRWADGVLQASPHLNPPVPWTDLWSRGGSPVVVSNGVCRVVLPATGPAQFYRLRP